MFPFLLYFSASDMMIFFPYLYLQLIENSVCLLRNLSYHVHREIPGCERFQEALPLNQGPAPSSQKGGCFSSRKSKGLCQGRSIECVRSAGCRRFSLSKETSHCTETGAHARTHVTCTNKMPRFQRNANNFPQQRNGSSPAPLLSVCVSLGVLICYSQIYTPPSTCDRCHLKG